MAESSDTVYSFSAQTLAGRSTSLSDFKGRVLLIVNTASQCGFTPQYAGLELLYQTYKERGLEVLGFPCNQFGAQEPGTADEIGAFCEQNYGVTFPMFAKIDVNGEKAHPLYQFLKKEKPRAAGAAGRRSDQVELHEVSGRSKRKSDFAVCVNHQAGESDKRY